MYVHSLWARAEATQSPLEGPKVLRRAPAARLCADAHDGRAPAAPIELRGQTRARGLGSECAKRKDSSVVVISDRGIDCLGPLTDFKQ